MRINVWAPAPNRHMTPLLDELYARGALAGAYHASPSFHDQRQLGGPSSASYPYHLVRDFPGDIESALASEPGAHNLIISFEAEICKLAMYECRRQGRPYSIWTESLQPRSLVSPVRVVRDLIYRFVASEARAVFAQGPLAARQMIELGLPRSIIYPAAYPMPSLEAPHLPKVWGRIVYCGRLIELKRVADLIRAIGLDGGLAEKVELLVVGEGPERGDLERLAHALGVRSSFAGSVDAASARALIGTGQILALPTGRREGWGYVVNEAIEAGVCVVVSDKVGAAELVLEGVSGQTFQAANVEDLSLKLHAAVEMGPIPASFRAQLSYSLGGESVCDYLLGTLAGERPAAPWLGVVDEFGGNEASAFWAAHRSGPEERELALA